MLYSPYWSVVHGDNSFNWTLNDAAHSTLVFGYGGNDHILASSTDFYQGPGSPGYYADVFDGGAGTDYVIYELADTGVDVDLTTGVAFRVANNGANFAPDFLYNIEGIWGSNHGDTINGDGSRNFFNGFGGDDTIRGHGDDDTISGGGGNDFVDGGSGDDFLEGNAGDDEILGGPGDDTVVGGAGADEIWLDGGADTVAYGILDAVPSVDTVHDFELGVDRFKFPTHGFFAEPLGDGVELSDMLAAFPASVRGGSQHDALLVANTTDGFRSVAVVKDVSAADMLAAIADESILGEPAQPELGFDFV